MAPTAKNNHHGFLVYWKTKPHLIERSVLEKQLAALGELKNQPLQKFKGRTVNNKRTVLDLLANNTYKSAMLRAIKSLLKLDNDDREYKRSVDKKDLCIFTIRLEKKITGRGGEVENIDLVKEMEIHLRKASGEIIFKIESKEAKGKKAKPTKVSAAVFDSFTEENLRKEYQVMQRMADMGQISTLMRRIVETECYSCAFKGGVVYVPGSYVNGIETLEKVAAIFPDSALKFFKVSLRDDASTKEAVREVIEEDLIERMSDLMKKIEEEAKTGFFDKVEKKMKGGVQEVDDRQRFIENRRQELEELVRRVESYNTELSAKAKTFNAKLQAKKESLNNLIDFTKKSAAKKRSILASLMDM